MQVVVLAGALLLVAVSPVMGLQYFVNTTANGGLEANDGLTWGTATTLNALLLWEGSGGESKLLPAGSHTVFLGEGTFGETPDGANVALTTPPLVDLTLVGFGTPGNLVGASSSGATIFTNFASRPCIDVVNTSLTVRNAIFSWADSTRSVIEVGATGTLVLDQCHMDGRLHTLSARADVLVAGGRAEVRDSTFTSRVSAGYVHATASADVNLTRVRVVNVTVSPSPSGRLFVADDSVLRVTDSVFRDNVLIGAGSAQAVIAELTSGSTLILSGSEIHDNSVTLATFTTFTCDATSRVTLGSGNRMCGTNPTTAEDVTFSASCGVSDVDRRAMLSPQDSCGVCGGYNAGRQCDGTCLLGSVVDPASVDPVYGPGCPSGPSGTAVWYLGGNVTDAGAPAGSATNPFATLLEAVPQLGFGDTLRVRAGTYPPPTATLNIPAATAPGSAAQYAGFTIECEDVGRPDRCVFEGNGNIALRLQAGVGADTVLRDLTFRGATSAALLTEDLSSPLLERLHFVGNIVGLVVQTGSFPTVRECRFLNSTDASDEATESTGMFLSGSAFLERCVFADNEERGIKSINSRWKRLVVTNSTFARNNAGSNHAGEGGGAISGSAGVDLQMEFSGNSFFDNVALTAPSALWTDDVSDNTRVEDGSNVFCDSTLTAGTPTTDVVSVGQTPFWDSPIFSGAVADACGVCNGGNASQDCAGTCGGFRDLDVVGDCCDLLAEVDCNGYCDQRHVVDRLSECCLRSTVDCDDVCNGTAVVDQFEVCCIEPLTLDCNNTCNGTAELDHAAVCCQPESKDCNGTCFGSAVVDQFATCCVSPLTLDCNNTCNGTAELDHAAVCCQPEFKDCNGTCFGGAVLDRLETCCVAPLTVDCNNTCDGPARNDSSASATCCLASEIDVCGICFGDNSTCTTTGSTGTTTAVAGSTGSTTGTTTNVPSSTGTTGLSTGAPGSGVATTGEGTTTGVIPAKSDSGNGTDGDIIYIYIGVAVLLCLCCVLIGLIACLVHKKKKKKSKSSSSSSSSAAEVGAAVAEGSGSSSSFTNSGSASSSTPSSLSSSGSLSEGSFSESGSGSGSGSDSYTDSSSD